MSRDPELIQEKIFLLNLSQQVLQKVIKFQPKQKSSFKAMSVGPPNPYKVKRRGKIIKYCLEKHFGQNYKIKSC